MPVERLHLATLVTDFDRLGSERAILSARGLRLQSSTYGQLATLSRRFAAELSVRGVIKGDRVLLCGENTAEWVGAFFGCVLLGVLPVPIDAASPDAFFLRIVHEVSPRLVVLDSARLRRARTADVPLLVLEDFQHTITDRQAKTMADLSPDDPLQIIFTSGTTGAPKGVVHTHGNVLASLQPIENEFQRYRSYERLVHPIRVLHTLPLSHVFGQFMGLWTPPVLGLEVHYRSRLVAEELIAYIKRQRISVLAAVPRVLDLTEEHLRRTTDGLQARLERARHYKAAARWWHFRDVHRRLGFKFWALVSGGAALSSRSEQFWNALGFAVIQGYGMTETTALVSLNHPFKLARGTVGQVLPGREVKLSDEGEVMVRGATISNATWHGGGMQTAQSDWLATGDLAELDAGGNLRFRGRKKETIVTAAGLNIYPEDLEEALAHQPELRGAAVVEIAGPAGPEAMAVLLAIDEEHAATAVATANQDLADYQQIRRWVLWPEADFPRTSTGKVLRRELACRLAQGSLAEPATKRSGDDLALDSLGRVELQAQMEAQFGVALDDRAVQSVRSQADLHALVRSAAASGEKAATQVRHRFLRWPWAPVVQAVRAVFLEAIAMPLLRLLAKPKLRTPPVDSARPLLLVANHITSYDAPFILFALTGGTRRRVAIAMSGEMLLDLRLGRNQGHWFLNLVAPLAYWAVTVLFNVFPLPQTTGFRRSFQHAGEAVDRGYSVMVFPEGRRSDNGALQPFKTGTGLLWKELGIPALPVRIDGLGFLKTSGRRWFRSGKISVSAGKTLFLEPGKTPDELTQQLSDGVISA